jgi:Co/Zn/Cd efflux system component
VTRLARSSSTTTISPPAAVLAYPRERMPTRVTPHRHGRVTHAHPYVRPHRHLRYGFRRSTVCSDVEGERRPSGVTHTHRDHAHGHPHAHGHSHGLVDPEIVRSREGIRAVAASLGALGVTAFAQFGVLLVTGSVALLADLIHNVGDALTAVPLGIAFSLRNPRAEQVAGLAVVLAIFVSACVALYESIQRFVAPQELSRLWVLAAAGVIGFIGNEVAAQVRLRAGRRLASAALIADGNHARTDGFVSLGVVASAIVVALGFPIGDPLVGLAISLIIFRITWQSWRLISQSDPADRLHHTH